MRISISDLRRRLPLTTLYKACLVALLGTHSVEATASSFLQELHYDDGVIAGVEQQNRSYVHYGNIDLLSAENQGDIANIGVLIGLQSIAIFDTGGSPLVANKLLDEIRLISSLPVSHIIISHAHPDHWMGVASLLANTEAKLVVNQAFVPALTQRTAQDIASLSEVLGAESEQMSELNSFSLTQLSDRILVVDAKLDIQLGGRPLQLSALPISHTNNDLILWDENNKTLWAGDLFFVDHVPTFEASLKGLQKSRQQIDAFAADLIVSGHGQPSPDWQKKWQKQWHYFEALTETTRQQIADGESLLSALSTAENTARLKDEVGPQKAFDEWVLMDTFHPRNVTRAYRQLEWD